MRTLIAKMVSVSLSGMLGIAATPATTEPHLATTTPVVVSRVVQNAEGKKYLEVDGKPFLVGHVQNAGVQETLGNQGGAFATPLPLDWMENLFEKTKAVGFDTISIILRWRDWEPTTRGVYDWTVIDKYVDWADKYGLRIDFAYFGSNSCGGTRLKGYNQGWATFVPDYLQDKEKYFGNGLYVGVNHMPWLPDGGPHDADARFVMNSEVNAVGALFDHLAVKDTTHRTILFQVQNEPDWHGKYNSAQKPLVWNWMNAIGNAVKTSDYRVATRVNAGGNMPFQDFQSISGLSGIDGVGDDAYSNHVEVIGNVIRNQSVLGGTNLPHISENDGGYGNHTSLELAALVNGGYYDVWELDGNNGQAMYTGDYTRWTVGTPGTMTAGTTRMSYLLPALSKIGALVSTAPPHRMAGFNIDTDAPVAGYSGTKQVYSHQVRYTGNDVALALSDNNSVYVVSDTSSSAAFKVYQRPLAVTSGHQDSAGAWVVDTTKTFTDNGDGSYSVTAAAREAIRIELPAATGTVPPAATPAPYSNAINVAPNATATASSSFAPCFGPHAALDGVASRFNYQVGNSCGEWASNHELNPWTRLEWSSPQRISSVALFDRPNSADNANGGTLSFSDGSSVTVSGIDASGTGKTVTFPDKTVTWVRFQVVGGSGINVGLSELQVLLSPSAPRPSTLVDISAQATATASSTYDSRYAPANATDGIIGVHDSGEWASRAEQNPWIKLTWPTAHTLNKITFHDRVNSTDWAPGGTLTFSDGSTVAVSGIPNNGTARTVSFPDKEATWVTFQVAGGSGFNVGLSELRVYSSGDTPAYALGNVALNAAATASSQYNVNYTPAKAVDGITDSTEWASAGEQNPWIQVTLDGAKTVNQVVLHDRPNAVDNATSGTLTFSDGSSVPVSGIPTNGSPHAVPFPNKTITWVRFQVTGGAGPNVGLAELRLIPAVPPASYPPSMPDVGWWKFDEAAGGTAYSSASFYNKGVQDWHNAALVNAATATGRIDNALNLNGSSGYAMVGGLSGYSLPNDTVTYSLWAYANSSPAGRAILQNRGGSAAGQLGLAVNAAGRLEVQVTQANGTTVTATEAAAFPTGSWQPIAVVADGAKVRLYRGGVEIAAVAYDGTLKTGFAALGVGVRPNNAATAPDATAPGYWSGMVDDVRVYSRALNTSELANLAS
jgi:hypothetical protein